MQHIVFICVNSGVLSMLAQRPTDHDVSSHHLQGAPLRTSTLPRPARAVLHGGFVGASSALLIAALGTDCFYYATSLSQWSNFSAWLICVGLIIMLVALILLMIDFVAGRARRLNMVSFALVLAAGLLSLVNAFVHSRDAWTSVVPDGILLSAVSAILLVAAGARGWSLALSRAAGDGL
jgi:uncharacterized membrane protein